MALSGYALYYFASDAWLPLLHWSVGLSLPLVLLLHISRGWASGRKQVTTSQAGSPALAMVQDGKSAFSS